MEQRQLGRTGLSVGALGLGTEYLLHVPRETMAAVVAEAVDHDANCVDLLYAHPAFLDEFVYALEGRRDKIVLLAHYGAGEENGQSSNIRGREQCQRTFEDMLRRLRLDYVDVLMLQMVDEQDLYDTWGQESLEIARRYQREGLVRHIAMSGHKADVALHAVRSGDIDILMFPVNLASHAIPANQALFRACADAGVGVVAMKPYAGGQLLRQTGSLYLHRYVTGGEFLEMDKAAIVTPVQCLHYVLNQPGVCTVVPGVKSVEEWRAALVYFTATPEEKDYAAVIKRLDVHPQGVCVYCNHCLPCPAGLDIAATLRLVDDAQLQGRVTPELRAAYQTLAVQASSCSECYSCLFRCPYEVPVIGKMRQAVELYEAQNV